MNNPVKSAVAGLWPVLFVLALPFVTTSNTLSCTILIYALAAMACNLLLGYAGLLSFCQGVFFGLGGYLTGLVLLKTSFGLMPALAIGTVGAALVAGLIGMISIRRHGIYFVMLTLAFAQLFYFLAYSQSGITGGDNGLNGVTREGFQFFGLVDVQFSDDRTFYGLVAVSFLAIYALLRRIINSPLGSTLMAIRENENRVWALGYDPRHYKILAFVLSGAITGFAGALDGMLLGVVPLSNIDANMSQSILIAAILGGAGSLFGSVMGAATLVLASDYLSEWWPRWQLILGVVLILLVMFTPDGFSGIWRACVERLRRNRAKQIQE
jgi:branched-chain amino acid transport system permease protein